MNKLFNYFHHLLIPKEENNYRAKALQLDFLTYYLVFVLVLTFSFKKLNLTNVLGYATDITVEKLYQLTNQKRQENNLSQLSYNDKLATAAYQKAQDMFAKNYWSHYGPDGSSPWDFIISSGYKYEYAGENLAKNFLFSQGVVDAWMNSASHRENILRKDYSEVGFAIVNGVLNGEETTLVVQMFGKSLNNNLVQKQTSIAPTVIPTTIPKQLSQTKPISSQPEILAKKSVSKTFSLSRFNFDINLIFLVFIALALIMDFYFSVRLNIIRINGKNIAHLIFITFIILGLTIFTRGAIM